MNTINNKLKIAILSITILSLVAVGIVVAIKVSMQTKLDFTNSMERQIDQVDISISNFFTDIESNVNMLSSFSLIKEADKRITTYVDRKGTNGKVPMKPLEGDPYEAAIYQTLGAFVSSHSSVLDTGLGIEENGGYVQFPESDRDEGYDARQRSWYKLAMSNPDKANFSNAYTTSSGKLVIYSSKTIKDDSNKVRGVVTVDVDLSNLSEMIGKIKIGKTGYIVLADELGTILSHPKDDKLVAANVKELNIKDLENINEVTKEPFETTLSDGKDYIIQVVKSSNAHTKMNYIVFVEKEELASSSKEIITIIIFAIILIAIISFFVSYLVSHRISKPIKFASEHIRVLGEGDFTNDIPDKYLRLSDEVGDIMKDTKNMQTNLIELITNVSSASNQVATSSNELMETSQQTVIAADEVARTIEEISKSTSEQAHDTEQGALNINELGNLIEKDLGYIQELNSSAVEVDQIKDEALDILNDLVEKTKKAYHSSEEVSGIIVNTNNSAMKIESASQMIKSIADQTNLLALNASIEAARAGEAGKGFAVVADEIRKLAEQSNQFTEEISSIIQDLTSKTEFAVKTIQEVGTIVQSQAKSVSTTNEKFERIAVAIDNMKKVIDNVTQSGHEMEEKKTEIIAIIENLSASSEENAAATEEASASVEEQTAAMEEISHASKHLAQLSQQMKENIDKFKY
ncbi:methyl-accepting chemotaxis protein [Ferdinandcohnia quinoae]|uniref:Methyl-accepting chemotaxis protein n=1 Tax=Fredinandcohnia quinoae TaxID=2918902 RepID=A0AAW5E5A4_9BACI|nr:methyl-accepting chemotaxis protein [Fredinandcohnia sp. SECRCQ15]MCH1627698.1 methyl-accepting chemotaxis protein [Fredinandcohnia sp. SECRCQ15]